MDRLSDAAWNGNVATLNDLLGEDRGILLNAALDEHGPTPLHISCLAGHLPFVRALMQLRPAFARDLNPADGFTPLHIASALGFLEIARVLLENDPDLCLVPGMDNKIPLHCAVIKGRSEIVRELIIANTDSIDHVTARGETVLHLAVKNNQFSVFQDLVEHLNQLNKERVLNAMDDQGNTILHLAVSRKLYQVINLLLDEQVIAEGTMDLNSSNNRGLTPLDVLQLYQSEAGDRELEDILRRAGARTTQDLVPPTPIIANTPIRPPNGQPTTWIRRLVNYFMCPQLEDSRPDHINFLLIIAILVVTATYQAALSPPGGVWQEDRKGVQLAAGQVPHDAGKAIRATKNPIGFKIYLFFNTIGFYISISLIYVLTSDFPMRAELLIAMFALCFTYGSSLGVISPDTLPDQLFHHLCVALGIVILPLIIARRYILNQRRDR